MGLIVQKFGGTSVADAAKIHKDEAWYREHGLSTLGDETGTWYAKYGPKEKPPAWLVVQDGCEPGDLTKRIESARPGGPGEERLPAPAGPSGGAPEGGAGAGAPR